MKLGTFKPTMRRMRPQAALLNDIRRLEKHMKKVDLPKIRLRPGHRPERNDEVSAVDLLYDFHARLPNVIRRANLGDDSWTAYEVGRIQGINHGLFFKDWFPENSPEQ